MTRSQSDPCIDCGKDRPEDAYKVGWRRGYCHRCYSALMGLQSTERTRRWRENPDNLERDREISRAWKERNREKNRERDREYARRKRQEAA